MAQLLLIKVNKKNIRQTLQIVNIFFFLQSSHTQLAEIMTPPLVHQDFRGRVCGVCFLLAGKNARRITNTVLQDLRMYQWEGYSLHNNALPTVVCCSCTNKLARCRGVRIYIINTNLSDYYFAETRFYSYLRF